MLRGLLLFAFICCSFNLHAQNFSIELQDNTGLMHMLNVYRFTQDSLVITAKSDYGRTTVNYLKRKLDDEEKKSMQHFIKSYPADSLKEKYYNEYSNFGYIDAEHFPREIEVEIVKNKKTVHSKMTNAYVALYDTLIQQLNPFLSGEVKIKFEKNQFNAFY